MSRDPLVAAVVRRYKQANASKWLAEVDQLGIDDVEGNYRHDAKLARGYIAKCKYLDPIFRALAGPMMTPVIGEFADRMAQRVQDVEKLMTLVQAGVKLTKKVQKEFDDFIDEVAEGRNKRSSGLIEAVHDLPSMVELFKIAEEAGDLQDRLYDEDESGHIDWTLEDYLGGEAKVYDKIEKASSGMSSWFQDEFGGARILYGFVKYLADSNYIQDLVQEARDNLETETE
jgi:hypothetical protein